MRENKQSKNQQMNVTVTAPLHLHSPNTLRDILEANLTLLRMWAETQGLEEAFDDQFQAAYEVSLRELFNFKQILHILHGISREKTQSGKELTISKIIQNVKILSFIQLRGLINLLLQNPENDQGFLNDLSNQIIQNHSLFSQQSAYVQETPFYIPSEDFVSQLNDNITLSMRAFLHPLVIEGLI